MAKRKTTRNKLREAEGLGDVVEAVTEATGIKKVVKWLAGEDCGCDERKAALNKAFPLKRTQCMTEEIYNRWTAFRERTNGCKRVTMKGQDALDIKDAHAHIFKHKPTLPCTCSPNTWNAWVREIDKVYETYKIG